MSSMQDHKVISGCVWSRVRPYPRVPRSAVPCCHPSDHLLGPGSGSSYRPTPRRSPRPGTLRPGLWQSGQGWGEILDPLQLRPAEVEVDVAERVEWISALDRKRVLLGRGNGSLVVF